MANDTRVAGIYSEIKYKFDPKSLKQLKQFKKDITDLERKLKSLSKLKASPKVSLNSTKELKTEKAKTKAVSKRVDEEQRLSMVISKRRKFEDKLAAAGVTGGELGRRRAAFNKVSGSFASGKKTSGQFNLWLEQQYDILIPKAKALKVEQQKMSQSMRQYTKETKKAEKALQGAWSFIGKAAQKQDKLNEKAKRGASIFKKMRSMFVGMVQAYTAFSALANVNNVGKDFENAGIMMETALGDKAGPAMEFLIQQSRRLGIDAAESAKGFSRYALAAQQLGFSFEEVKGQFLGVAEAATVFGLSQDQITGTIRALEQMASKGQIMAEELKLQLGDRMPAVMQIAAKSMGMTTKEFLKAMEDGKVAAEDFLPAFSEAMRELAAPGLEKAFKSVSFAQKKMMAEWKLFKNSLFTAGLDKLFKALFHTIEDLLVVMRPFAVFLVSALSAFIRGVLFPIRFVIALIGDLFDLANYYMNKFLGFNLDDVAETIGTVIGTLASLIGGAVGGISKAIRWIVSNSFIFKMIGQAFSIASKYAGKLSSIVSKIVEKLRSIPIIGNMFKGASKEASKLGGGISRERAGSMLDTFFDKGTMVGGLVGGANSLSEAITGKSVIELMLTDEAKENFKAKTKNETDNLNVSTRG